MLPKPVPIRIPHSDASEIQPLSSVHVGHHHAFLEPTGGYHSSQRPTNSHGSIVLKRERNSRDESKRTVLTDEILGIEIKDERLSSAPSSHHLCVGESGCSSNKDPPTGYQHECKANEKFASDDKHKGDISYIRSTGNKKPQKRKIFSSEKQERAQSRTIEHRFKNGEVRYKLVKQAKEKSARPSKKKDNNKTKATQKNVKKAFKLSDGKVKSSGSTNQRQKKGEKGTAGQSLKCSDSLPKTSKTVERNSSGQFTKSHSEKQQKSKTSSKQLSVEKNSKLQDKPLSSKCSEKEKSVSGIQGKTGNQQKLNKSVKRCTSERKSARLGSDDKVVLISDMPSDAFKKLSQFSSMGSRSSKTSELCAPKPESLIESGLKSSKPKSDSPARYTELKSSDDVKATKQKSLKLDTSEKKCKVDQERKSVSPAGKCCDKKAKTENERKVRTRTPDSQEKKKSVSLMIERLQKPSDRRRLSLGWEFDGSSIEKPIYYQVIFTFYICT